MKFTFLGTASATPRMGRNVSGNHLKIAGDDLLFDCGEGTQRQLLEFGLGMNVDRIFLTHLHGDHSLGIPPLIRTLDLNGRSEGLEIFCPEEEVEKLEDLVSILDYEPSFSISCIGVGADEVIFADDMYEIKTVRTDHRCPSVGFVVDEHDRVGELNVKKAEELGVPKGPKLGRLKNGEAVETDDGRVVSPDEVIGPDKKGRRIVITGDTRPVEQVINMAQDAELLVHDATFLDEHKSRAVKTSHSTAKEVGEIARKASVDCVGLTHISNRYDNVTEQFKSEAKEEFEGCVVVAEDGKSIEIAHN